MSTTNYTINDCKAIKPDEQPKMFKKPTNNVIGIIYLVISICLFLVSIYYFKNIKVYTEISFVQIFIYIISLIIIISILGTLNKSNII